MNDVNSFSLKSENVISACLIHNTAKKYTDNNQLLNCNLIRQHKQLKTHKKDILFNRFKDKLSILLEKKIISFQYEKNIRIECLMCTCKKQADSFRNRKSTGPLNGAEMLILLK